MADIRYSLQQRIWIVKQKIILQCPVSVQRQWSQEFGSPPPSRHTINSLYNKFETTGSVLDAHKPGRPTSVTTPVAEETVEQHYEEHPRTSARRSCQKNTLFERII